MKKYVYQTGTINSLIQAVYEGDTSIKDLKEHGDFGLGTFDLIDGELIACDGHFYRADKDGNLEEVNDSVSTPFAMVNTFKPDIHFKIDQKMTFDELETFISDTLSFTNSIYSIKINADFESISMRSEECQLRPFRSMDITMPYLQNTFQAENIKGVLVGYWFPKYLEQVNVPGFHFHFISDDKKFGGHVFNFKMNSADCFVEKQSSLHLDLIKTKAFDEANLYNDDLDKINSLEKQR